jgi:hypothetical protein
VCRLCRLCADCVQTVCRLCADCVCRLSTHRFHVCRLCRLTQSTPIYTIYTNLQFWELHKAGCTSSCVSVNFPVRCTQSSPCVFRFDMYNGLRFSIGARSGTSRCVARRARRILTSGRPRTGASGLRRRTSRRGPRAARQGPAPHVASGSARRASGSARRASGSARRASGSVHGSVSCYT